MAWIESHQNLLHHPKVLDLMNLMEWDADVTLGKLHRFWWWCMDYAPDGDLRRHTASILAAAVGVPRKKANQFVNAMIQARWLEKEPYFRVHDWWEYAGPFLQTKHKRHPETWQLIKDLYGKENNFQNLSQKNKIPPGQPLQLLPTSTDSREQSDAHSPLQIEESAPRDMSENAQTDRDGNPQSEHMYRCSTGTKDQTDGYSTPQNEQTYPYSTGENNQTYRYCAVPPNQPNQTLPNLTVPDITKQNQQQLLQHLTPNFQTDRNSEHPGRHQQQPSPTRPSVAGAAADDVGPGLCTYTPPTRAVPENDLKQIIYDRIGHKVQLSRLDMAKIAELRNRHGARFFAVCDSLHGGVTNPAAYLHSILEPEDSTGKLVRRMRELLPMRGTKSN
jgi:hypothetical protein